jgi:hypothetical protein
MVKRKNKASGKEKMGLLKKRGLCRIEIYKMITVCNVA